MKTRNMLMGLMLFASLSLAFTGCSKSPVVDEQLFEKSATLSSITDFPTLISGEDAGIIQMREEEKLAHDVYMVMAEKYDLPIFANIASSETNHYDAIGILISAYNLTDPSTGDAGTFTSNDIAELYQKLVDAGNVSLTEALKTGAYIEEYDIADLEKLIAATTNRTLLQIYGNLLRGSRNHLRSFVSTLSTYQITYTPAILSTEAYNEIISSPMETGNGMTKGNGKGNSNRKGQQEGNQNGNNKSSGICINR